MPAIVIAGGHRKKLGLKTGSQFVVVGDKDVVILKSISPPAMSEFDQLLNKAAELAEAVGLKEIDIEEALALARGKK